VTSQNLIRDFTVRRNFFDSPVYTQGFGVFGLSATTL